MKAGNLSNHFRPNEFACKCGCGQIITIPELVRQIQYIRNVLLRPIKINCANRCIKHNVVVGGEIDSLHLCGWAADISFPDASDTELENIIHKIETLHTNKDLTGGLGIYKAARFIHIDIGRYRKWNL